MFVTSAFAQTTNVEPAPAPVPAPPPATTAPVGQAAPVDGTAPVEGAAPVDQGAPDAHPAPVGGAAPVEGAAPVDGGSPDTHVAPAGAESTAHGAAGDLHEGVEAEHSSGVFPPFDPSTFPSQLLWLAITFGLFYLFLKNTLLPRVGNILEVRGNRIAGDLEEANRLKMQSDAAIAAYEHNLAEARGRANSIAQEARDAARQQAAADRQKVEDALATRLQTAEASIASIKTSAMNEVGAIAEETAGAIVQRLLGVPADAAAVASAVRAARV